MQARRFLIEKDGCYNHHHTLFSVNINKYMGGRMANFTMFFISQGEDHVLLLQMFNEHIDLKGKEYRK